MNSQTRVCARISGLGKYLPRRILTNQDLERMVETNDEWIVDRTGIRERRIAADDETASTMGAEAARMALAMAGVQGQDIDLVIAASTTPDGLFPSVASLIQHAVGARNAGAFDINAACVGFISGLATASQFIAAGSCRRVLVVGTDVLSRIVDWSDRGTCVLFGDGAGAVLVEASDRGGPLSFVLRSDGAAHDILYAPGPCGPAGSAPPGRYYVHMDGQPVFKFAVNAMETSTREALAACGLGVGDVDLLVPHQANLRIINATARALRLPLQKAMVNVDRYGNTSSASIPMALQEAWEQGRLHDGDRVVLVGFGGGLVWGAMVLEWASVPAAEPQAAPAARAGVAGA